MCVRERERERVSACVCVRLCVCERERDRDRDRETQTDRQIKEEEGKRDSVRPPLYAVHCTLVYLYFVTVY